MPGDLDRADVAYYDPLVADTHLTEIRRRRDRDVVALRTVRLRDRGDPVRPLVEDGFDAGLDPGECRRRVARTEESAGVNVRFHVDENLIHDDPRVERVVRSVDHVRRPQMRR